MSVPYVREVIDVLFENGKKITGKSIPVSPNVFLCLIILESYLNGFNGGQPTVASDLLVWMSFCSISIKY